MRQFILAAALAAPLLASASTNLVANGSFEDALNGWTQGGSSSGFAVVDITYNQTAAFPISAFGEAVAPNNAPTNSPDAVGEHAAYFVDDFAVNQSLSQTVFLAVGSYQVGFSAYAPSNGYANAFDAAFSGVIAGQTLASYLVSTGPATTWQTFASTAQITTAGNYLVEFKFNSNGAPAKDLVIDNVYLVATAPVPEPQTYALMLAGLLSVGYVARRRRG